MHAFWVGLLSYLIPVIVPVIVALVTIIVMILLSRKKENVIYVKSALQVLKLLYGSKLGDKVDAVFNIWLECLDKVQKNEWTEEQMIAEFFKIVSEMQKVEFSKTDKAQITEITKASVKILSEKNVKIQSIK